MKTLIELFDECQIENVIAALSLKPERVVFVGFKEIMTDERIKATEAFLMDNCKDMTALFETVGRFDLSAIEERLCSVVSRYPDPVIDLTGGKELVITATGKVSAEKNIPLIQFDIKSGRIIPLRNAENLPIVHNPELKISDFIILNGGSVLSGGPKWIMDKDFCKDILNVWEICRNNCGLWNRQATAFGNFEKYGKLDNFLRVSIDLGQLRKRKKDTLADEEIVRKLKENNLIYGYEKNGDFISFFYKNDSVRRLITKSGNVLELYGFMMLKEIMEEDELFADDCEVGIIVDWNGVISRGTDTRNEIDLMMIKDFVPVFISCKNGEVYKESLYELETMALKFGGEYAKKVMFASYVSVDADKKEYIKLRAADMGITLIDGIEKMSKEEFKEKLKKLI